MKSILSCFALMSSFLALAQPEGRVFTITNVPYTNISGGTSIAPAQWDDFDAVVPLNFNFKLFGKTTDTLIFSQNFNTGADLSFEVNDSLFHVFGMLGDFEDRSTAGKPASTVKSNLTTINGKKAVVIEFKDAGFYSDMVKNDFINFQYRFFEDHAIEVHYGPSAITTPFDQIFPFEKPFLCFVKKYDIMQDTIDHLYYVSSTSPAVMDSVNSSIIANPAPLGMNTWPTSGTRFRFAYPLIGSNGSLRLNDKISIYPTVVQSDLFIEISQKAEESTCFVLDGSGKQVATATLQSGKNHLDLSGLASGIYTLYFQSKSERVYYKIVKQ